MNEFRSMGPRALDAYLATHGAGPSPALDAICAQKHAHTTLLYWFTDRRAAIAEAQRTSRPILSLVLLGRLDEELSCANSRFFRKLLYPEPRINAVLRKYFVLHWQSLRPVPRVTIDFGDGRRIEKTLTGNSAHLVLDPRGRIVDAIPGLLGADTFLAELRQAHTFARADRTALPALHERAQHIAPPAPRPTRLTRASMLAATKHVVEAPVLRAVTSDVDADTRQNLALHQRIHEVFATRAEWAGVDGFIEWLYADLFEMPLSDPTLGLDRPDPV